MVEKIPVRPESVRGLGNIISPAKTVEDFSVYNSSLSYVDGFYTMEYSTTSVRVELTASASSIRVGESLTLTATVSDGGTVVEGASVSFTSGNLAIGTAVTGSDGVATLTTSSLDAGSYSITATYDEVVSSAVTVTVSYGFTSVTVTSDKSILSYADSESVVLTAQLMNGDVSASVSGETVDFYKYVDGTNDVLLGSDVTDSNGEASYSYASTGVGDVGLYAKVRSLVSETYGVQDCMFYDASSSVNLGKYSAQSGASFSYDSNNNAYNASPSTAGVRFVDLNNLTFSKDNAVSMDFNIVSTNNNAQIGFIIGNIGVRAIHAGSTQRITISNSAISSDYTYKDNTINLNTWYTLELLPTGVLNLKQNDTVLATCNYDISSIQTDTNSFKIYTAYTVPTTNTVRNIKVKPL